MEDKYLEHITTIRLPEDLLKKADALIPILSSDEQLRIAGRISRSKVLRLAIHSGMQNLVKTYGLKGKRRKNKN